MYGSPRVSPVATVRPRRRTYGEPGRGMAVRPRRVYRERQPAGGDSSSTAALGASPSARRHLRRRPGSGPVFPASTGRANRFTVPPDQRTCRRPALPALRRGWRPPTQALPMRSGCSGSVRPSRPGAGRGCGRVLPPLVRHPVRVAAEARSLSWSEMPGRPSAGLSGALLRARCVVHPGRAPEWARPGAGLRQPARAGCEQVTRRGRPAGTRGASGGRLRARHVPRAAVLMRVARRSRMTESQIESS